MSDRGHFSSYEGHKERRTGKIRGVFSGMHRALDGWMLARAPVSPAQGLHHHRPVGDISIIFPCSFAVGITQQYGIYVLLG